jgi:hypothetical protein
MPAAAPEELPEVARHEREQRRAAAAAREPAVPGLLPQAAADGKTARGAVRPDGSQVHLLSAFHVTEGRTMAQREVDAKTNEIPELLPMLEGLDLDGMVITAGALHGQRETARKIREDLGAHYLLFIKANQPSLLAAITDALTGLTSSSRTRRGLSRGKATAAARSARSAPRPPTAPAGPEPPRSCASAATPARRTAPGTARRSPMASPASPPASRAPATSPSTHEITGQSKTASITSHSGKTRRKPAPAASRTPMPASATSSSARSGRKGTPTLPQPAATTAAMTSASSLYTATSETRHQARNFT